MRSFLFDGRLEVEERRPTLTYDRLARHLAAAGITLTRTSGLPRRYSAWDAGWSRLFVAPSLKALRAAFEAWLEGEFSAHERLEHALRCHEADEHARRQAPAH